MLHLLALGRHLGYGVLEPADLGEDRRALAVQTRDLSGGGIALLARGGHGVLGLGNLGRGVIEHRRELGLEPDELADAALALERAR